MKLRFTLRAVSDLEAIAEYLRAHGPQGAAGVRAAIQTALANITAFPKLGRRQTLAEVRMIAIRRFPYRLYYRVDEQADEVVVLTIQHTSQDSEFMES